jgi:hypothetical protein
MMSSTISPATAVTRDRPVSIKILLMLLVGAAAGTVGYFVGKLAAGATDFSAPQLALLAGAIAVVGWAARDMVVRGAKPARLLLQLGIGALVGATAVVLGILLFGDPMKWLIKEGSGWQMAAAVIGAIYILFATILVPIGFRKKLNSGEDLTAPERKQWQTICNWSALVSLAYGTAVLVLLGGSMQAASSPQWIILAGVALAMLAQAGGTWILWQRYDELWRAATKDSCAITFALFEIVLFLWAAAALAGFDLAFDPLGLIVVFSAIYLGASFYTTLKRGMDEM